jgi:excisionase family DNA binding protein
MSDPLIVMSRAELATLIRSEVTSSVRLVLAERVEQSDWMDLDGAAEMLGYTREHVARLAKAGKIPSHRIGKPLRFLRSELDAFVRQKIAKKSA